jgi:hypothetical protein
MNARFGDNGRQSLLTGKARAWIQLAQSSLAAAAGAMRPLLFLSTQLAICGFDS